MKWLISLVVMTGCVESNAVVCGDGLTCPQGTVCTEVTAPLVKLCATEDQLAACAGKAQLDPCDLADLDMGRCYDGVCLEAGCGNLRMDPGEVCDDGNAASGDTCSADCLSLEICGNGIVDVKREICDDGNLLDHDGCSSTCQPERLRWFEQSGKGPAARLLAMSAYDPLRSSVVLFGGGDNGQDFGDTWQWTGADWAGFSGSGANTRSGGAMAFDGNAVMLYGGISASTLFGDTWTFDGLGWTPHSVAGPGPRWRHAMAYDSRRKRVVVYGGYDDTALVSATWEWDGTAWTQITTANSPGAKVGAMMAYDPIRDRVVLAGGTPPSGAAETWVYDGISWTNVTPSAGATAPEPFNGAMAFDSGTGKIIAFGGCSSASCSSASAARTLAWDGTSWTVVLAQSSGPAARIYPQLASTGNRLVLFGGAAGTSGTALPGTWVFEAGGWQPAVPPPSRVQAGVAHDQARNALLVFGGYTSVGGFTYLGDTWELTSRGWTQRAGAPLTVPTPEARVRSNMAYDPVSAKVVLFGGNGFDGSLEDTWLWDGSTWAQQSPSVSPAAPRVGAAMAFDGQHVALFGGNASDTATYHWTGTSWAVATPATSPTPRLRVASGYDPVRKQLVMFGGTFQNKTNDETWTYDGTTWTKRMPAVRPGTRADATLAWNPAMQRLILTGGAGGFDVWAWDGSEWTSLQTANEPPRRDNFGATTALTGGGTLIYSGSTQFSEFGDLWELRWEGDHAGERCHGDDQDEDDADDCADPDCWTVCTPSCPPGTSCPADAPRCGDGACDLFHESCRTCSADCTCAPVCGDLVCDPGETCLGDC